MKENLTNWCELPTGMGTFRMYDTGNESVRVVCFGDIFKQGKQPLLRIHSSCLASEVFAAIDCDCADQLREAMKLIAHEKRGIIVHLHQEGRGQGLSKKIKAVNAMQFQRLDTYEAYAIYGYDQDIRTYSSVVDVLNILNISSVRLISNNPRKQMYLEENSINVEIVSTHPNIRPENIEYLKTKNIKFGHSIPLTLPVSGPILFYHSDQPWGEFSNFSQHAIFINNKIWQTIEHFYQAQKFNDTELQERIRQTKTPTKAKELSYELPVQDKVSNWCVMKDKIMYRALKAKFTQHPDLTEFLLMSKDTLLIEHTSLDNYWGDGIDGKGLNRLGQLLMQLRSEIKHTQYSQTICSEL